MKRVLPIFLSLVLVISLAVPVFASAETYDFPALPASSYPYVTILYSNQGVTDVSQHILKLYFTDKPFFYDGTYIRVEEVNYELYKVPVTELDNWEFWLNGKASPSQQSWNGWYWSNYDILGEDGSVFHPTDDSLECDGSSCPANDLDHNNICDDCGKVLTYNLRSTLLSYVQAVADDYSSGYPYYAVFENTLGGYNLYFSKQPITINGQDYDHVVGTSGQWTRASTDDSGVHSHGVFASWDTPVGGTLVYANHNIENFQMPPLAVVIQGVTEGELMEVTLPNLAKTMKILVPCGVGCLALLIVLSLFGKRSLIFRN